MAIYHDDFESYSPGPTTNPFGGFTRNLNAAVILDTDNYLPGGSQCVRTNVNFSDFYWTDTALRSSATVYAAIKFDDTFNNAAFFQFFNGDPLGGPASHAVFTLALNFDATISAFAPNATLVATPCAVSAAPIKSNAWHFLQVNFVMHDIAGFVTIDFEVAIDKVTVFSGTVVTGVAITDLVTGTAQWNFIRMGNSFKWDEWTLDTLQAIGTFPDPGSPAARVTTGVAEIIESTTSANAVVSTGLIELIIGGQGYVYEA